MTQLTKRLGVRLGSGIPGFMDRWMGGVVEFQWLMECLRVQNQQGVKGLVPGCGGSSASRREAAEKLLDFGLGRKQFLARAQPVELHELPGPITVRAFRPDGTEFGPHHLPRLVEKL